MTAARPSASLSTSTRARRIGLAALLLIAFLLRVWNLNWDEGTHQHPDERFWSIVTSQVDWVGPGDYFDSRNSELNPYTYGDTYVYGTLPLFTTKAAAGVLGTDKPLIGWAADTTVDVADRLGVDLKTVDGAGNTVVAFDDLYNVNIVGRLLAALIDTGTVLLAYLLGRELLGRRVGFAAATLLTFAPLHIQYSHFHGAEPWVTFFVTLGVLLSVRLAKRMRRYGGARTESARPLLATAAATGVVFGLATSSKLIGAFALVVPAVAIVVATAPALTRVFARVSPTFRMLAGALGVLGVGAVGAALALGLHPLIAGLLAIAAFGGAAAAISNGAEEYRTHHPHRWASLFDQDAPDPHRVVADRTYERSMRRILTAVVAGVAVLAAGALTFRIFQPYAFDGLVSLDERFTTDLESLERINAGGGVPWVIQWIGRTPLWFPLQSAFWWGMGPPLAIAVVLGTMRASADVVRRHRWMMLLPLALLAMMLGLVSQQFNPLIRYLLPAYPVAIVLGGYGVVSAWDAGRRRLASGAAVTGQLLRVGAVALVAGTAFWGLAFVNGIYNQDHTRIEASRWMADNLPSGAVLTTQAWDDSLPLPVRGIEGFSYTHVQLDPFQPDRAVDFETGEAKVERLLVGLDQADYVVEASNRIYDSVSRFPSKYPATTAYYDNLFAETLGFEQIAEFQNTPSLFGIDLPDADAEETWTVYDHPTVTIWQKTDEWSIDRARAILNPARATQATDAEPKDAGTNGLRLQPDTAAALRTGETFNESFGDDGPTGTLTWLWWLAWLQLAAFAVLPWTTALFSRLPDKGYGLSKVVGFATVGLFAWSITSWDIADFGRDTARVAMGLTAAIGLVSWWPRRRKLATMFAQHGRAWVTSEVVFLLIFGLTLWLRAQNPDLWEAYRGGEKPMELAYLTAIARTSELPSYDPWFAGGFINYYYVGWFLLAVPMRALRVLPEVGFQLGVATYAALAAVTAFSVVHNLVALSRRRWAGRDDESPAPVRAGLAGVLLFLGIGNLDAIRQHYDRLEAVNTWERASDWPLVGYAVTFVGGTWRWIRGADLAPFDWWAPSRVTTPEPGQVGDITEFPYFTFLFGDLHPHMMGLTFVGLTVALALAYVTTMRDGTRSHGAWLAVGLGVTTGLVRTVNTWDFPTAVVLAVAAVGIGAIITPRVHDDHDRRRFGVAALVATVGVMIGLSTQGGPGGALLLAAGGLGVLALVSLVAPPPTRSVLLSAIGHGAIVAAVHVAVWWPFLRNSETFDTGIQRAEFTSPFGDFLTHWGIFFGLAAALGIALVVDLGRRLREDRLPKLKGVALGTTTALLGAALIATTTVSAAFGLALFGALGALVLMAVELRRTEPDVGRIVALGMVALAFAIAGGPDVVTVENDISRMNTVFKFWLQAWQLLALAGGFAIWQVGRILAERLTVRSVPSGDYVPHLTVGRPGRAHLWVGIVGAVILAGLAYPLLATAPRTDNRFDETGLTLDGLAYLDTDPVIFRRDQGNDGPEVTVALAQDLPLIEWLRENVEGRPTTVEWTGNLYDWNSRFAIHTGLPTVLGWDWHQRQQRGPIFGAAIDQRRADVQRLYTVPDAEFVTTFLQTYDVGYVIIGTQEHRHGNAEALATIVTHPALRERFRSGDKAILEVIPTALWPGIDPETLALAGA